MREIDSHQVIHTLREHGNETKESVRGQIAVTMNDIANYRNYTHLNPTHKQMGNDARILPLLLK